KMTVTGLSLWLRQRVLGRATRCKYCGIDGLTVVSVDRRERAPAVPPAASLQVCLCLPSSILLSEKNAHNTHNRHLTIKINYLNGSRPSRNRRLPSVRRRMDEVRGRDFALRSTGARID